MSLSDASRAKSPREAFVRLVPNRRESLMPRIADIALMLSKTSRTMSPTVCTRDETSS